MQDIARLLNSMQYYFFLVFPSLLPVPPFPLNNLFQKAVPTQDVTNPVRLPSCYYMQDIARLLNSMQYYCTYHTIGPTDLLHPSPAPHFNTFITQPRNNMNDAFSVM